MEYFIPFSHFMAAIEENGEYCDVCECDEPMQVHVSEGNIGLKCICCENLTTIQMLAEKARNLPCDYVDRLITGDWIGIDKIGDDVWVTDRYAAELAGNIQFSYPERATFKKAVGLSELLDNIDINTYKKARVSNIVYRDAYNAGLFIAALKAGESITYIKDKYTKYMKGIDEPYITVNPHSPVLVKRNDKVIRLIMPFKLRSTKE